MSGSEPRLPEEFKAPLADDEFHVSELVSNVAGAHSPFGDHVFPLPVEKLQYVHPSPENRPNLADGR